MGLLNMAASFIKAFKSTQQQTEFAKIKARIIEDHFRVYLLPNFIVKHDKCVKEKDTGAVCG